MIVVPAVSPSVMFDVPKFAPVAIATVPSRILKAPVCVTEAPPVMKTVSGPVLFVASVPAAAKFPPVRIPPVQVCVVEPRESVPARRTTVPPCR